VLITIRELRRGEERLFLELHARSIRGLALQYYPPVVIDAWCVPPTKRNLAAFVRNHDKEVRLLAEVDGAIVGLGALCVKHGELRACYVAPEGARKGIGTALVQEIERLAVEHRVERLALLSSINAEPFYASLGYHSDGCVEHAMRGYPMAAIRMSKPLPRVAAR
jgi:putative acetyltransferase